MDLLLKDLRWHNGTNELSGDVRISNGIIKEIGYNLVSKKSEHVAYFKDHFIYPGLINAHDHLEMNLYPKLGTPPYANYVDWANAIYKPDQSPLKEIEKVHIEDRLLWGGIKNLISGVTTVIHHNPWHRFLGKEKFPIRVLKKIAWAHSLAFCKKIQKEFPKKNTIPFVIHAAEGKDALAFSEIFKLYESGFIKRNTVLIHAIAVTEKDIEKISENQSSVVWCPSSNHYMFDQTAPIQKLKKNIRIALGSDSTLTGSPTFLDEMQVALKTGLVNESEIYTMITQGAAEIFNLPFPSIALNCNADFFIVPVKKQDYFENLLHLQPSDVALVVINGCIKLAAAKNGWRMLKNVIKIQGVEKCFDIDIASLKRRIEKKVDGSILETNPLWKLIECS